MEVTKSQLDITNKNQQVSPFPAGDHMASMNRRESMTNTRTQRAYFELKYFKIVNMHDAIYSHKMATKNGAKNSPFVMFKYLISGSSDVHPR